MTPVPTYSASPDGRGDTFPQENLTSAYRQAPNQPWADLSQYTHFDAALPAAGLEQLLTAYNDHQGSIDFDDGATYPYNQPPYIENNSMADIAPQELASQAYAMPQLSSSYEYGKPFHQSSLGLPAEARGPADYWLNLNYPQSSSPLMVSHEPDTEVDTLPPSLGEVSVNDSLIPLTWSNEQTYAQVTEPQELLSGSEASFHHPCHSGVSGPYSTSESLHQVVHYANDDSHAVFESNLSLQAPRPVRSALCPGHILTLQSEGEDNLESSLISAAPDRSAIKGEQPYKSTSQLAANRKFSASANRSRTTQDADTVELSEEEDPWDEPLKRSKRRQRRAPSPRSFMPSYQQFPLRTLISKPSPHDLQTSTSYAPGEYSDITRQAESSEFSAHNLAMTCKIWQVLPSARSRSCGKTLAQKKEEKSQSNADYFRTHREATKTKEYREARKVANLKYYRKIHPKARTWEEYNADRSRRKKNHGTSKDRRVEGCDIQTNATADGVSDEPHADNDLHG